MHGPRVAPVILKHPILARIDEVSRDLAKVAAMRELLASAACEASALADVAVRHGVCSRELADYMLRHWANVGGDGWLGEILPELQRGILEACDELLESELPLSSWWILGLGERFQILLARTERELLLFMTTPPFPPGIGASKRVAHSPDPFFRPVIEEIRDQLDAMLGE